MLLDRRNFLSGMPALLPAGLAAAAESPRTRFYIFDQYLLEQGSQTARIHDFFSKALLPAMDRIHKGPKLFLEALITPHMPQVATLIGIESPEQAWSIPKALFADKEFSRAFDQWEAEPTAFTTSSSLLEATDYSPEIVTPEKPAATPRVFELRVYHAPTNRQNRLVHERFAGGEIQIFHRCGIHPLLYTNTVFGAARPNLTYVIPFADLAAREKAWAAFGADEAWLRLRASSTAKGQLNSVNNISLFKATPYSPIR